MAWAPFAAMAASTLIDRIFPKDKPGKLPTMTPQQEQLLNRITQMLGPGGQLGGAYQGALGLQQQLMDPSSEAVQQFADPYMREFEQQTVPGLAERFAGGGALGGGLSSSGFGQALGAAGANLQSQLAALKAGLGQQAAQQLMAQYGGLSGKVLGAEPFAYTKPQYGAGTGFMQQYAQAGFPGAGQAWGGMQDWMVNSLPGSVV